MFVHKFTKKKQIISFFTLVSRIVNADGEMSDIEQKALSAYSLELRFNKLLKKSLLNESRLSKLTDDGKQIDEILTPFLESSDAVKKSLIFELIAVAICDSKYSEVERDLVQTIADALKINNKVLKSMEFILDTLHNFSIQAELVVGE